MKRIYLLCTLALMLLASCGQMTKSEIDNTYSSGVVMILTQGYYSATTEDGMTFYFTSFKDGEVEGLTFNKDDIEMFTITGTGFFVSDDGLIATNRHVVSSPVSPKDLKKSMKQICASSQEELAAQFNKIKAASEELEGIILRKNDAGMNFADDQALYQQYQAKMADLAESYESLGKMNWSNMEIEENFNVSVAFNNTFVEKPSDFKSCVIRKISHDADLAIIQLKSKRTPKERHIFEIPSTDPLEDYSLTDKMGGDKNEMLYVIGYNSGMKLAFTDEGIKSQITEGSISQNKDNEVMYTIPTMPGSSGSPVLNKKGELVAVHYAGIGSTQNFNYGIKVRFLYDMFK